MCELRPKITDNGHLVHSTPNLITFSGCFAQFASNYNCFRRQKKWSSPELGAQRIERFRYRHCSAKKFSSSAAALVSKCQEKDVARSFIRLVVYRPRLFALSLSGRVLNRLMVAHAFRSGFSQALTDCQPFTDAMLGVLRTKYFWTLILSWVYVEVPFPRLRSLIKI